MSREAFVSVTVGFAPATTPGLVTGGTAADSGEEAPEGLFAALLAMLSPNATTDAATPEAVTSSDFTALIQSLVPGLSKPATPANPSTAVAPESDASVELSANDASPRPAGKLKDLADALIALSDALQAGKPIDPALEDKLDEALDAIAIPVATMVAPPQISALASSETPALSASATIPTVPPVMPETSGPGAIPPQPAGTDGAATTPLQSASTIEPSGTEEPSPPSTFSELLARVADIGAGEAQSETPELSTPPATSAEIEAEPNKLASALRQLGERIDTLSKQLQSSEPELAARLEELGNALKSGTLPDELAEALTLDAEGGDPEIDRILEALDRQRATPKPAAEARTFAVPTLELPEAVQAKGRAADSAGTSTAEAPEQASEASLENSEPDVARPTQASASARAERPEPAEATKPASTPSVANAQAGQADSVQGTTPPGQPAAAAVTAAARSVHAAYQAPVQQVNLPQVAFEVVRQFDAGNTRFQIRLDPPELGRIDVKLDVDGSGTVNARMTVERPETLDLMQRDQRALQLALQQAGLDASKTNLEFSLRQNPFAQQPGLGGDGQGQQGGNHAGATTGSGGADVTAPEITTTLYRGTATAGGVNLFV